MKRFISTFLALCMLFGLFPVFTAEAQALCGTTGGNMDIILILDHSNSMYPPASDNATALNTALTEFMKIAFANNNAANNKIAIVQYDSRARAWDGSAEVRYNYSMTLSDYSSLSYTNCFMDTTAKVNAAISALMTTPDPDYTMEGMTNTMGGLRMAELVASTRSTTTTRDLLIVMFTDGLPTCRYFTSTKDWFWDNDGNATSAWEYTRALEAGQSLRKCVDKYTKCKSTIYNIALLNSSDITSQQQKVADFFMSNTANYEWTYDTNVNSDNYTDITQYVDSQTTYFKTNSTPWANYYKRLSSSNTFIDLCKTIANYYTKQGYASHNLTYTNSGDKHIAKCTQCEYTVTESHTLGSWNVTKPATCSSAGEESATCSICKYAVTRSIAQLPHTIVTIPAVPPTCNEPGLTEGSRCSVCNTVLTAQSEIPTTTHSYLEIISSPTCTEGGYSTFCCENCGDTYIDNFTNPIDHNYTAQVIEATCSTGGYTIYTCMECGHSYEDDRTSPSGHDYSKDVTAPTCTEQGYTTYTCTNCGNKYTSDYTSPLGHDYTGVVTEPTCSNMGFTTYICMECEHTFIDDYVVAASHNYVPVVTAPTCTDRGYTTYTCSMCGTSYTANYLPELNHSYNNGIVTLEPTCSSEGSRVFTCTLCGNSYSQTIPSSGHNLEFHPATAATCEKDGNKVYYYCDDCDTAFIDETCEYSLPLEYFIISALGHNNTYVDSGKYHTATCSKCSKVATEAHTFINSACICGAVESSEPEYLYNPKLTFNMGVTVGVEMAVNYSILASTVSSFEDFYLFISKNVAGSEPITVAYGQGSDRIPMGTFTNPSTGEVLTYKVNYKGISAKEMGDSFTATLFAIDECGTLHYGPSMTSSIKDTLMEKIRSDKSIPELKKMAVDMLKYGAAAQVHLKYDTNNLVTKDLTAEQLALGTQGIVKATNYSSSQGVGKTINTAITISDRVRLGLSCLHTPTGSEPTYLIIDTASAKVLEELPAEVTQNVMCRATFAEVGARDMRRRITIALYDGDNIVSQFLIWSVESYVAQVRQKTNVSQSELNMANTLLAYGDSVAAYMTATNQ